MNEEKQITVMRREVSENVWKPVLLSEAIHELESGGYWKEGTSEGMLKLGLQLYTPLAQFCIPKEGQTLSGPGDNLEQEFRLEVKRHLDKCDAEATPRICQRISTTEG